MEGHAFVHIQEMTEPWHHCVSEFDNIDELNTWLNEWSAYEQDGNVIIKKIYRSADKAYFVWWLSDK